MEFGTNFFKISKSIGDHNIQLLGVNCKKINQGAIPIHSNSIVCIHKTILVDVYISNTVCNADYLSIFRKLSELIINQ